MKTNDKNQQKGIEKCLVKNFKQIIFILLKGSLGAMAGASYNACVGCGLLSNLYLSDKGIGKKSLQLCRICIVMPR